MINELWSNLKYFPIFLFLNVNNAIMAEKGPENEWTNQTGGSAFTKRAVASRPTVTEWRHVMLRSARALSTILIVL